MQEISEDRTVYKIAADGTNVFVTKKHEAHGCGFHLRMLYPYPGVQWYYDGDRQLDSQECIQRLREVAAACRNLYFLTEINYRSWIRDYQKFRFYNSGFEENFCRNFYMETLFAGMQDNESFFPEKLSSVMAKCFFKSVLLDILASGTFGFLPEYEDESDFQIYLWESGYSITSLDTD